MVKRTDLNAFSNVRSAGIIALGIEDGDSLVAVFITDGSKDILLSTARGMSIRFAEAEVRSMGRQAYGVKGITLEEGDEVVGADVVEPGTTILTVTENGYGKRTEEAEYRVQGRGGKGIIDIKTTERNGTVVGLAQVKDQGARHLGHRPEHARGPAHLAGERRGKGQRHLQAARGGGGER